MYSKSILNIINPAKVNEYKFIGQFGDVKVYEIDDTPKTVTIQGIQVVTTVGQLATRQLLNANIGFKKNPWCFVQNVKMPDKWNYGKLSLDALYWWKVYSLEPKLIAFKFGKIYGFRAIAGYDKLAFMKLKNISETEFEQYKDEFYRFALPWLDRYNNSYVYLDENGNFVR